MGTKHALMFDGSLQFRYNEKPRKSKSKRKKLASKKKMTKLSGGRTKLRTGRVDTHSRGRITKHKDPKPNNESIIVKREDPLSIFATVRKSYEAIDASVSEWMQLFQDIPESAIAVLLTFVVHSSGCVNGAIETNDLENLSNKLDQLIDLFPSTDDYPIVSNHPTFKQFRKNFSSFWTTLIENCSDSFLFEPKFSEFFNGLNEISKHSVRAFRHTATLAGYIIIDQIIQSIKDKKKQLIKAEKRKTRKNGHIKNLNEQIVALEEMILTLFGNFFENRYKDTVPDIRGLGVESLGVWVLKYPDTFLSDQYLRYFGWLLADKHSGVRELVLKQLLRIYAKSDWHSQLNKFTKRYLSRIVEIAAEDVNVLVSVNAIQLVTMLLQHSFLEGVQKEDEYISSIESLLFDENALRRQSAAEFIQSNLSLAMKQKKKRRSSDASSKNEPLTLDDFLQFVTEHSATSPNVASHVVDNFWKSDVFLQWKTMTDKLLETDNDSDQENIIKTLRASVQKLFLNGESLYGSQERDSSKNKTSKTKESKNKSETHQAQMDDMTSHLAKALPALLKKFQSEKNKILPLLEIPQYFILESYDTHQLHQYFEETIKLMKSLFWKHTDTDIHATIAKTFSCFLKNQEYSQLDKVKQNFDSLIRELEDKLKEAISQFEENENTETENQNTLGIALQRISNFVSVSDIQVKGLIYQLMRLLRARGDGGHIYDSSTQSIINILFTTLCYRLHELVKQKERTMSVTYEELYNNAMEFKSQLIRIINLREDANFDLRLYSYYRYCDLVTLFNLYAKGSTLRSLSLICHENEVSAISKFFQEALEKDLVDNMETEENESNVANNTIETRKRFIIASISRLITVGEFEKNISKYILSYFSSPDKSISSSVKYFWRDIREKFPYEAAQFEIDAMKMKFEKCLPLKDSEDPENNLEEFLQLGIKFSQTHFPGRNVDLVENVLRDAIQTAVTGSPIESYIHFLKGFTKHLSRLDGSSINHIKGYVQQEKRLLPDEVRNNDIVIKQLDEFIDQISSLQKKKQTEPRKANDDESEQSATRKLQFHSDSDISETRKRKRSDEDEDTQPPKELSENEDEMDDENNTKEPIDSDVENGAENSIKKRKRRKLS